MSFKNDLLRLRYGLTDEDTIFSRKPVLITLDDKVDEFIDWYFKNIVKGKYTDIGEYHAPRDMRNLIEKIAVWYELRYPSYEINRMFPGSNQENNKVNDVMFRSNPYINELFDETSDVKELEWNDFYNTSVFMKSLPWEERCYLTKPRYREIVYLDLGSSSAYLYLTRNGFVKSAENITNYTKGVIKDEDLTKLNIKDVVELFKDKKIKLPLNNEMERAIKDVDNWNKLREGIFDCAMYRIIERGGNRIGPRRGFLFAKEFNRNIDIPMMYGVDYSDPGLRLFINEYIKAGGSKELSCYSKYFMRSNKNAKVERVTIQELFICDNYYTNEEKELHQKLVNVLASQIDYKEVENNKVKQLRIERKINKDR